MRTHQFYSLFFSLFLWQAMAFASSQIESEQVSKLLRFLQGHERSPLEEGLENKGQGIFFKVHKKIGQGNHGRVYHIEFNKKHYALKQFDEGQAEENLQARAELLQQNSFFLKRVAKSNFFEVQELGGANLESILPILHKHKKSKYNIFLKILIGVKTLHDKGYAHFDLKWSNIILERNSVCLKNANIKIIDLDQVSPPSQDLKVGTHFYMSAKRQIATDEADFWNIPLSYELGMKEDIFSLGIMLLETLVTNTKEELSQRKSYRKLLKECCHISSQGESYSELIQHSIHERFRKKEQFLNEKYIAARKLMYNELVSKITSGAIVNPQIILAARAIHPEAKQRISIDEFILEWINLESFNK